MRRNINYSVFLNLRLHSFLRSKPTSHQFVILGLEVLRFALQIKTFLTRGSKQLKDPRIKKS